MISSYPAKRMVAEYQPLSYPEFLMMSASFLEDSLPFTFVTRTMVGCRELGKTTSGLIPFDGKYFRIH
jgi:hypothetical protein